MNPLELIKQGIIGKKWELVRQGYGQITGESIVQVHQIGSKENPATSDQICNKIEELKNQEEEEDLLNPIVQPTEQKGILGTQTVLITDGNPSKNYVTNEAEREFNRKRAEARGPRKIRPNDQAEVICNECDTKFISKYGKTDRKCPSCLKKHIHESR